MGAQNRLLLKIVGTALVGPFCLPPLIFGSYLGICWVRIHTTSLYYVEYPFFLGASISTAVAALSIFLTLHGVWRRSYYGVVFVPPVLFGLVFMIQIPDLIPYLNRSMVADSDFLSNSRAFLQSWYEQNHRFPNSETEFQDAMAKGSVVWRNQIEPLPVESAYSQHGTRLPYQVVVLANATGPRLRNLSSRPGIIYYATSTDQQRFWITMTGLQNDTATAATVKRIADLPNELVVVLSGGEKTEGF